MKHLFLAAVMFTAITGSTAQVLSTRNMPYQSVTSAPLSITAADIAGRNTKQLDGNTQGAAWNTLYSTIFRSLFYVSPTNNQSTVIEYDAPSNSLSVVRTLPEAVGQGYATKLGVMRSMNDGGTWTFDIVKEIPAGFIGFPNMAQIRTGTDPLAWPILLYGNTYSAQGQSTGYYTAYQRYHGNVSELPFTADAGGGLQDYQWSQISLGVDRENESFLAAARLGVKTGGTAQYGGYGFFNLVPAAEAFLTEGYVSAWGVDKFRQVSPVNKNSTLSTQPLMDVDRDGRVYVAFNNILAGGTTRDIMVSTSDDGGVTWSPNLNVMPNGLFQQLATTLGAEIVSQQKPYEGGTFIVTAPQEYSYFFTVATGVLNPPGNTDGTFNITGHIVVEAQYKAGIWSLNMVTPLNVGVSIEGALLDYPEFYVDTTIAGVSVAGASRSIELEAALTADGNSILLKYLDQDSVKVIPLNPPVPLNKSVFNQGLNQWETVLADNPLDTLVVTDVYMTHRDLSSNTWSVPNNVTNDLAWNRQTYIPRTIPSLTKVPLVQVHGVRFGNDALTASLPQALIEAMGDQAGDVQFTMVNALVTDVKTEREYAFSINSVVPNPATNLAEVTFSLDKGAVVSADLFDVLGNNVRSLIAPAFIGSGPHGVSVDVNALAPGQYFVAITVNGNRLTRTLTVVK